MTPLSRETDTMRRLILAWLLLLPMSSAMGAGSALVEEVLVTGEHPGPGLWRVSSGDHSLWILGTHSPLPQRMTWRSQDVESILAEAQQIIGSYSVSLSVGGQDAFRSGAKLKDVLPSRTYSRWRSLKRKYVDSKVVTDDLLPSSAALLLQYSAFEKSGLTYTDGLWREIARLAKKYRVPVTTDHQIDDRMYLGPQRAEEVSREAQKTGVEYLTRTMARLESDIKAARTRANAWATGDIEALKAQALDDQSAAYMFAYSWPFLHSEEVHELLARADANWLAAAEVALTNNTTTFAALPIYLILKKDGVVAKLREAGYTVEEPL
jgi:uncharacterized protein YbaP (TraB family)